MAEIELALQGAWTSLVQSGPALDGLAVSGVHGVHKDAGTPNGQSGIVVHGQSTTRSFAVQVFFSWYAPFGIWQRELSGGAWGEWHKLT